MIQLKNTTDSQVFHILKNNPKLKSTPKRFQSKDYLANKVGTFKILPDEGYFAMTSVNLDVDFTTDSKSETYTENGEYQVLPNEDSVGLSDVTITVDVQPPLQDKQVTYNELGTYNVEADEGYYGLDNVEITFEYPLEKITDTVTVNGTYTYEPSEGYKGLSKVDISVETSGLPIDLKSIGWSQDDINVYVAPYVAGVAYAKQIQDNWDPAETHILNKWSGNKKLIFFPTIDCRNLTDIGGVFWGSNLVYLQPLEFNNITNARFCFAESPIKYANLTGWKGTADCSSLFSQCRQLDTVIFPPEFTPSDLTNAFEYTPIRIIEGLNLSKCLNANRLFFHCNLNTLETDISKWDTSYINKMEGVCSNAVVAPVISNFDVSGATTLSDFFNAATNVPNDLSKWNTSKCGFFKNTFYQAKLNENATLNLSGWDFNSVGSGTGYSSPVNSMFAFASSITSVNLTNAKMDQMKTMSNMWYYSYVAEIILDGVTLPKIAMDFTSSYITKHTLDTVLGILNALPDITGDGLSLTCKLGTQDLAQLTDEQKAIGTSKGWTLA